MCPVRGERGDHVLIRRLSVAVLGLALLSASMAWAAYQIEVRGKDMSGQVMRPYDSALSALRRSYFHPSMEDIRADPVSAAESAIRGRDWRLLIGGRERIEGVECSLSDWFSNARHTAPMVMTEVAIPQVPSPSRGPMTRIEREEAVRYTHYNRRIIADPLSPLRPFCRSGGATTHHNNELIVIGVDGRQTQVRPWQLLGVLPSQRDMLAAVRAGQRLQVSKLPLPNRVDHDFLQLTFLGWAAVHSDYDLLTRVARETKTDAYCRSLEGQSEKYIGNIPNPIHIAIARNDALAVRLLMRALSSPLCDKTEGGAPDRSAAFTGALHQAEKRGPEMVLAVVQGFQPRDRAKPWGLAGQLREKNHIAAAQVAARRYGAAPWLSSAAYDCDIERTRFWVGTGTASDDELRYALRNARGAQEKSSRYVATDPNEAEARNCLGTIVLLEAAIQSGRVTRSGTDASRGRKGTS